MSARKVLIDEITIAAELDKRRNLDTNAMHLVLDLIHAVGRTSAATEHAGIIRKHADARPFSASQGN